MSQTIYSYSQFLGNSRVNEGWNNIYYPLNAMHPFGTNTTFGNLTALNVAQPLAIETTFNNLQIATEGVAVGSGNTLTVTLVTVDATGSVSASPVTCTMANSDIAASDTTNEVTYPAGTLVCIKIENASTTPNNAYCKWGIQAKI